MDGVVRVTGSIGFGAGRAAVEAAASERGRGIGRYRGQASQPRCAGVKASVHARGGGVRGHDAYVMMSA
eukprot:131363-Pleurochrysis_carterae.AAC.1